MALTVALTATVAAGCGGDSESPPAQAPAAGVATLDEPLPILGLSEPNAWRRNPPPASPLEIARLVADLGATSQRLVIDWSLAEPNPPGAGHAYEFGAFDPMYDEDLQNGIRPLLVVLNAPRWAWEAGASEGAFVNNPPAPDKLSDWAAFVSAVARRYPEALGIEVWNEPNLATFWGGGGGDIRPDPVRYIELLRSSYDAVKTVDPAMLVLGGALASNQSTSPEGNIPASEFARSMYEHDAAAYMDAISLHPYPGAAGVSQMLSLIDEVRAAGDEIGAAQPVWLTEIGVSTTGAGAATEAQQAQQLVDLCRAAVSQPSVDAVYFHNLIELPRTAPGPEPGYGLVQPVADGSLRQKPAFDALDTELAGECGQ
jgi:hypothetical protein